MFPFHFFLFSIIGKRYLLWKYFLIPFLVFTKRHQVHKVQIQQILFNLKWCSNLGLVSWETLLSFDKYFEFRPISFKLSADLSDHTITFCLSVYEFDWKQQKKNNYLLYTNMLLTWLHLQKILTVYGEYLSVLQSGFYFSLNFIRGSLSPFTIFFLFVFTVQ